MKAEIKQKMKIAFFPAVITAIILFFYHDIVYYRQYFISKIKNTAGYEELSINLTINNKILFILILSFLINLIILYKFINLYRIQKNLENQCTKLLTQSNNLNSEKIINKRVKILSKDEYSLFSYRKVFTLKEGRLVAENSNSYQHLNYYISGFEKEINFKNADLQIRRGNFSSSEAYFIENRIFKPNDMFFHCNGEYFSFVEITMDKEFENTNNLLEDNFPRKIKFLGKYMNPILEFNFNKYGFMTRIRNEYNEFLFIDKIEKVRNIENMVKEIINKKMRWTNYDKQKKI